MKRDALYRSAGLISPLMVIATYLPWMNYNPTTERGLTLPELIGINLQYSHGIPLLLLYLTINVAGILGIIGGLSPHRRKLIFVAGMLGLIGGVAATGTVVGSSDFIRARYEARIGAIIELLLAMLLIVIGLIPIITEKKTPYQPRRRVARKITPSDPISKLKQEILTLLETLKTTEGESETTSLKLVLLQRSLDLDLGAAQIQTSVRWFLEQTKEYEAGKITEAEYDAKMQSYQELVFY